MPILTQDTIGLRQARSIRNRTEEISDELVELRAVAGKPNKAINFVQAGIWGCVSLANQWKSLTAIISVGMEQDQIDDYRGLAEILRPAAKEFVRFCEVVHAAATKMKSLPMKPAVSGTPARESMKMAIISPSAGCW